MKVRHLHEADIDQILSLWNRHSRFDQLTPELLEEKIWDDIDFSKDLAFVVEHENQIIALAFGVIRQVKAVPTGFIKFFVVDQKFQRRHVGSRLLEEMEERFVKLGAKRARIGESPFNYLTPGLDPRYTKAMVFFEKKGYIRFGETWNLEVDLSKQNFDTTDDEKKIVNGELIIERAKEEHRDLIKSFLGENFAGWEPEVLATFKQDPISCHIALEGEKVIAFSAYDGNNFNTGWFGPMGTSESCRGKGIGGILLKRCLADIKEQGHRYAIIPWVGPIAFYSHYANAEVSRVFYRYEKELS